jgi:histidinol-phosphate/aromatic aminotransferase/cobyric acid decarboxylase-like protein
MDLGARRRRTLFRECFRHLPEVKRKRIAPTPANDMRLHRLERPEPWELEVLDAIADMPETAVNHYPDYAAFYRRLADFVGIGPDQIVVGQGIEEFIRTLVLLCCEPGEEFAYTWPTCAMFDVYAEVFGAKPCRIVTDPARPLRAEDIKLSAATRLLILPNPGQPVDECFSIEELRAIAALCESIGAVLAIDEAYHWFGAPSALALTMEFDNVVVLRTFSKAFGAAGLRVGFAIGSQQIVRTLDAIRLSGEIGGPSIHAATVLMDRWESHILPGIARVVAGRDWLRQKLESEGFPARGRWANHVLANLCDARVADATATRLKARGVHVRVNEPPLHRHLLITCGSVDLMRRFYREFRAAL